uniref:ER lumen protein-retaining receptor n=1 Tax=Molossus molossus TaxID=27622 RepID=A0A7J8C821_MOLMO|nr:KDEL endoplasmic reticulum protein retention receptor 1 [Molossus molossus]
MKVVYIACSFTTVWMIYSKFKATYDGNHDTFRVEFLVVPTAILAFLVNHDFTPLEILWTFSIYLESVAILPQLFMVSKTGEAETITSHYLFALGVYRTLYLFNWIWRYYFEGFFDLIAIVAGLVQTVLYCDFFYLYITKGSQRGGQLAGSCCLPSSCPSSPQPCITQSGDGSRSRVPGSQGPRVPGSQGPRAPALAFLSSIELLCSAPTCRREDSQAAGPSFPHGCFLLGSRGTRASLSQPSSMFGKRRQDREGLGWPLTFLLLQLVLSLPPAPRFQSCRSHTIKIWNSHVPSPSSAQRREGLVSVHWSLSSPSGTQTH